MVEQSSTTMMQIPQRDFDILHQRLEVLNESMEIFKKQEHDWQEYFQRGKSLNVETQISGATTQEQEMNVTKHAETERFWSAWAKAPLGGLDLP
jgi:hypothetical protein